MTLFIQKTNKQTNPKPQLQDFIINLYRVRRIKQLKLKTLENISFPAISQEQRALFSETIKCLKFGLPCLKISLSYNAAAKPLCLQFYATYKVQEPMNNMLEILLLSLTHSFDMHVYIKPF